MPTQVNLLIFNGSQNKNHNSGKRDVLGGGEAGTGGRGIWEEGRVMSMVRMYYMNK